MSHKTPRRFGDEGNLCNYNSWTFPDIDLCFASHGEFVIESRGTVFLMKGSSLACFFKRRREKTRRKRKSGFEWWLNFQWWCWSRRPELYRKPYCWLSWTDKTVDSVSSNPLSNDFLDPGEHYSFYKIPIPWTSGSRTLLIRCHSHFPHNDSLILTNWQTQSAEVWSHSTGLQ